MRIDLRIIGSGSYEGQIEIEFIKVFILTYFNLKCFNPKFSGDLLISLQILIRFIDFMSNIVERTEERKMGKATLLN